MVLSLCDDTSCVTLAKSAIALCFIFVAQHFISPSEVPVCLNVSPVESQLAMCLFSANFKLVTSIISQNLFTKQTILLLHRSSNSLLNLRSIRVSSNDGSFWIFLDLFGSFWIFLDLSSHNVLMTIRSS